MPLIGWPSGCARARSSQDGVDTLWALCAAVRWHWPATLTVATAHDGLHLYFRAPADVVVASTIGRWPGRLRCPEVVPMVLTVFCVAGLIRPAAHNIPPEDICHVKHTAYSRS
ncbi:bifunctional DNA primase/polymerase [Micromonospora marina]|uniref:bifunctional DNA primase/polymerase n=1 Tax=Micromonospora marina TaxID=307120 RepID=UPI0034546DF2